MMYMDALVRSGEVMGQQALARYCFSPRSKVTVINLSENVTLRIDDPVTGERAVMRLHRTGYHHVAQIKSELQWLDALRASGAVEVPPPLDATGGDRVIAIDTDEGRRYVTMLGWLDGEQPDPSGDLVSQFELLGAATARLHRHAEQWLLPPGFVRRPWDAPQLLGSRPTFGPWRSGLGLGFEERQLLERAEARVTSELARYGRGPGEFGLVHADLRLANLLLGEGTAGEPVVRVIDFDDCGPSWFMYDFGSAVSFIEDDPRLPALAASWLDGYRGVRALAAQQAAQLATFVMLRRLVLVGWVARNHDTATEAAALGAGFTEGACEVAERYLRGSLLD